MKKLRQSGRYGKDPVIVRFVSANILYRPCRIAKDVVIVVLLQNRYQRIDGSAIPQRLSPTLEHTLSHLGKHPRGLLPDLDVGRVQKHDELREDALVDGVLNVPFRACIHEVDERPRLIFRIFLGVVSDYDPDEIADGPAIHDRLNARVLP
jgi:hypothetical protein